MPLEKCEKIWKARPRQHSYIYGYRGRTRGRFRKRLLVGALGLVVLFFFWRRHHMARLITPRSSILQLMYIPAIRRKNLGRNRLPPLPSNRLPQPQTNRRPHMRLNTSRNHHLHIKKSPPLRRHPIHRPPTRDPSADRLHSPRPLPHSLPTHLQNLAPNGPIERLAPPPHRLPNRHTDSFLRQRPPPLGRHEFPTRPNS